MTGILYPKPQHKFRVLFLDEDGINNLLLTQNVSSLRVELVGKTLTLVMRDDLYGLVVDELSKGLPHRLVLESLSDDTVRERRVFHGLFLTGQTFAYDYAISASVEHTLTLTFEADERITGLSERLEFTRPPAPPKTVEVDLDEKFPEVSDDEVETVDAGC